MDIVFGNSIQQLVLREDEHIVFTNFGSVKFQLDSDREIAHTLSHPSIVIIKLTNLRLIIQENNGNSFGYLNLEHVKEFNNQKSFWIFKDRKSIISTAHSQLEIFLKEHHDNFSTSFTAQLQKKCWLKKTTEKPVQVTKKTFSAENAGLSGLLKYETKKREEVNKSIQNAFQDLESLFKEAEKLIDIANKLTQFVNTKDNKDDDSYIFHSEIMDKMGIWSPVTRSTHKNESLYLRELSKQLSEFIQDKIFVDQTLQLGFGTKKKSDAIDEEVDIEMKMVSLTDLYCLFNRARGTELVSPEDLLGACHLFESLNIPLKLIKLESGFMAITVSALDEKSMMIKIYNLLKRKQRMTATQFASFYGIALPMAMHFLHTAEENSLLCRDESTEGLIFYPNLFFDESELEILH